MREKVIELLRKNIGQPVSGEEISRHLAVSRTAIWKHIQNLKLAGYNIEAIYKKGYILHSAPDLLLPAEIIAQLKTKWLGRNIIYKTSVKSTNDIAKQIAFDNCPHGTIVVSEEQISGRGRISRGWFSPFANGLWFSIVLRPPFLPHEAPKFTLMMAVAVTQAIKKHLNIEVGIKWPNDILFNGRKLVGILTEMNAEMEAINYIVIGTGVNVSIPCDIIPEDIKNKTISLTDLTSQPIDRAKLLATILQEVENLYDQTVKNGFTHILEEWRKHSITLNKQVKVVAPDDTFIGCAQDIDATGALLVKKEDGTVQIVLAGDVSIRAVDSDNYI